MPTQKSEGVEKMDEQNTQNQENSKSSNKMLVPVVIGALIILAVVGIFAYQGMKGSQQAPTEVTGTPTAMVSESPTGVMTPEVSPAGTESASPYKDGTYKATGEYTTPGGTREVDVTLTIKNGVVTDTTFTGHATDPNSKRFQGEFADGYKVLVVGKSVDGITLTKVSGSSLTPKGFNDAVTKIKAEAQA